MFNPISVLIQTLLAMIITVPSATPILILEEQEHNQEMVTELLQALIRQLTADQLILIRRHKPTFHQTIRPKIILRQVTVQLILFIQVLEADNTTLTVTETKLTLGNNYKKKLKKLNL